MDIQKAAQTYEPRTTKNIADLPKVHVGSDIVHREGVKNETEEKFSYQAIVENGVDYRVPDVVLKQLKEMLKEMPGLLWFKVTKTGTTMFDTKYTVIPLSDTGESLFPKKTE